MTVFNSVRKQRNDDEEAWKNEATIYKAANDDVHILSPQYKFTKVAAHTVQFITFPMRYNPLNAYDIMISCFVLCRECILIRAAH